MKKARILSLSLLSLSLMACEGSLGIDLSATPPAEFRAAVLQIDGLRLNKADGSVVEIRFDEARQIDLQTLERGQVESLISGEEVAAGNYVSVDLLIDAESQVLDSYLEDSDGAQHSLLASSGSLSRAVADFQVKDDEDLQLTVHFDLRSSLSLEENAAGDRLLTPKLRLLESGQTGAVSGDVAASLLEDAGCDLDNSPSELVYVFSGRDSQIDDFDGILPEALSTALVDRSRDTAHYQASFLPAGDYTLALSCVADLDDPSRNDDLAFVSQASVTVSKGETTTLDFF